MLSFFVIPREIRNTIHHLHFTSDPWLMCDSYDGSILATHYHPRGSSIKFAEKTIAEQHSFHAFWIYNEQVIVKEPHSHRLALEEVKMGRLKISVGWLPPASHSHSEAAVRSIVEASREMGSSLESVKIQGSVPYAHSQRLKPGSETTQHTTRIFDGMQGKFAGVEVGE
ncbi:hypothetical protein P171DRAFT_491511 [Karstenula rhodostoma CBS 690.94]|uniref:Uncharacterized protein n=1 Tax=Karstenula rhodostoma CBS 690.94 TaxID=1392251 RepID=A0A9P4P6E4_9PLEO|nr:hypothetical protein P171DRAFT_491511 [Karstenula rhodostoma CBS 690.94]